MSILELPDDIFLRVYLRVCNVREMTKEEKKRYSNCIQYRPRISKEDANEIKRRIENFDTKERIKKVFGVKTVEQKKDFMVKLSVMGEEISWPVTAFTMREAKQLAKQGAKECYRTDDITFLH